MLPGLVMVLFAGASTGAEADPAQRFLDAFYRFDQEAVSEMVSVEAGRANALYYLGWARAANYRVHTRWPCLADGRYVQCAVTVTDDFGSALGYLATDTFSFEIDAGQIASVTFEGDDPPLFDALLAWIQEHQPEAFAGPCRDAFAGGDTPAECARTVVSAARRFAR